MNCAECGKEFKRKQYNSEFCGGACRRVFNNRRAVRGAILYDLTMIGDNATTGELRAKMAGRIEALKITWRFEDEEAKRKRSWQRPANALITTAAYDAEVFPSPSS